MHPLIKTIFFYNGSLKFKAGVDDVIEPSYQHKFVVTRYLDFIKNRKVLDAGCWTGPVASEIFSRQIPIALTGMDENEDALRAARMAFPGVDFISCRLTDPPEELLTQYQEAFDTIIFLDVIEHLPKGTEATVLGHLNRMLKAGGVMILSTMAHHALNIIDPAWFFGHRHYRVKEISGLLEASGFESMELLRIGNLYWDLDMLQHYFYKHILRRRYQTGRARLQRIMAGFGQPRLFTRIYVLAQKQ